MPRKILIANRGEIACRVIKTARRMGIQTVAVYSDADANALHVKSADEAYHIGAPAPKDSYLRTDRLLEVIAQSGTDAVHPGYGFLSENAGFADALEKIGCVFVGPPASAIRAMGSKSEAKKIMGKAGVPLVPGYHGTDQDPDFLTAEAEKIGYPVLIKASAGGGGKGMRAVEKASDFKDALISCKREAHSSFGDDHCLIERLITKPRHVEIQVFADSHGNAVYLFERDCSLQRRHQKVIEEAPAPNMSEDLRAQMGKAAVDAAKAIGYQGAGTVEFLLDASGAFYFMEMNTRLQVEHPVTEKITGEDLVEWQLRIASGEGLPLTQESIACIGHAIECRIYAEDPEAGFRPAPGIVRRVAWPAGTRVESAVETGSAIPPDYDPMIAKIIAFAPSREKALSDMRRSLGDTHIAGVTTNLGFLRALLAMPDVIAGRADTTFIDTQLAAILTPQPSAPVFAAAAAALTVAGLSTGSDSGSPWCDGRASDREALDRSAPQGRIWLSQNGEPSVARVMAWYGGTGVIVVPNAEGAESRQVVTISQCNGPFLRGKIGEACFFALVGRSSVDLSFEGPRHVLDLMPQVGETIGTGGEIRAEMPGLVVSVPVAEGESVTRGATLMVLEAMKMEMPILSPVDGVIGELLCAQGDQVRAGQSLLRLVDTK